MPWIKTEMEWYVDDEIDAKLKSGEYERLGGVIRQADTKRIVKWLKSGREVSTTEVQTLHPFFRVIAHRTDLDQLSDEELVEFARFIETNDELAAPTFYNQHSSTEAILEAYDRRKVRDPGEAADYAAKKRQSLLNTFGRTYIPNLRHWVELDYISLRFDQDTEETHLEILREK